MLHASDTARDANLLGAAGLAVADRLTTSGNDAALLALSSFLEGERIEALASSLGISHSGTVRLVDRLEATGHVTRAAGADARSVSVRLTRRGRAAARGLRTQRELAMRELLEPLTVLQRSHLREALEEVLTTITVAGAAARHTCRLCDADACGHPGGCPVTTAAEH